MLALVAYGQYSHGIITRFTAKPEDYKGYGPYGYFKKVQGKGWLLEVSCSYDTNKKTFLYGTGESEDYAELTKIYLEKDNASPPYKLRPDKNGKEILVPFELKVPKYEEQEKPISLMDSILSKEEQATFQEVKGPFDASIITSSGEELHGVMLTAAWRKEIPIQYAYIALDVHSKECPGEGYKFLYKAAIANTEPKHYYIIPMVGPQDVYIQVYKAYPHVNDTLIACMIHWKKLPLDEMMEANGLTEIYII